MNKLIKKIIASMMAVTMAVGVGGITVSAQERATWNVYQHQGAPSSSNKYIDNISGVATQISIITIPYTFSMSSTSNYVHVYSSKGIDTKLVNENSVAGCSMELGESFEVQFTLEIKDNSYLDNYASGTLLY